MKKHQRANHVIHWRRIGKASLGVTLALGLVGAMTDLTHHYLLAASLGASSLLIFGYPDSAFSQPRNFIGGNLVTALIGLAFLHVVGNPWWAIAAATGLCTAAMMITDTLHPPAASTPIAVCTLHSGWSYLIYPNLSGEILVLAVALVFHRLTREEPYPHYWI